MNTKKTNLSPNQNIAANPSENVWVMANAGTGKTSVLVHRLLRILFRSDAKSNGILCLTYTNAGASEMRNRILVSLENWATANDETLRELLYGIAFDTIPTDDDLARARKIFYEYIDAPEILKIKTIHGFCEEILRRFPSEAGIIPSWGLISDADALVLQKETFATMVDKYAVDAFDYIVQNYSEYKFDDLLQDINEMRKIFFNITNYDNFRAQYIDNTKKILCLDTPPAPVPSAQELQKIIDLTENNPSYAKKMPKTSENIINTTRKYIDNTVDFEEYKSVYLTEKGTPRKIDKLPHLIAEQNRIIEFIGREINQKIFDSSLAFMDLAATFSQKYTAAKQKRGVLDFEDMILYTGRLLKSPETMGYVLSGLDLTLSHILVDEAQDTSPHQWEIIKALTSDFFTDGNTENNRSLFVVGDKKQSIYGFQGADSDAFEKSKSDIGDGIKNNARTIRSVPLLLNFRSTKSVLNTVDFFFDNLDGFDNAKHHFSRTDLNGRVVINRVHKSDFDADTGRQNYIKVVAENIHFLVKNGARENDIMILVQRRHPYAQMITDELQSRGLNVAGSDRVILPRFLAIRDMLNLVRFCLDTTDDYALACVLKSPLFGLDEDRIYNLAHGRGRVSLLERIAESDESLNLALLTILEWSRVLAPYSFFMRVLGSENRREKMISSFGETAIQPLEEFLSIALSYERTNSGMLKQFLKHFILGNSEIKREMDATDGIRIMTVHGSKGMESKYVFLIDTIRSPLDESENFLKLNDKNQTVLYSVHPTTQLRLSQEWGRALDSVLNVQMAEYWRLLYVAMTRARDELYVFGFNKNKEDKENWHTALWNTLQKMPNAQIYEDKIVIE